jgi:hypothetical protein
MLFGKRMSTLLKALMAVAVVSTWVYSFSGAPPPMTTGGCRDPLKCTIREPNCTQCHNSYDLNSGRDKGGDFFLDGAPDEYVPGEVYSIGVVIQHPGQKRWGFELAVWDANGRQVGMLEPDDDTESQIETVFGGLQYLEHRNTHNGEFDGPIVWYFNWYAPETSVGPVYFYAAGNAANGDGFPSGDYIYTTEKVINPAPDE